MLELRVLGPLEVVRDGEPVPLPRQMHRALLALLVLHRNEIVSTDSLIEELWSGQPPATAKDALQNYVSQLRKALGRDVIATQAPGYVLDIEAHQTDAGQFEQLVAEARAAEDPGTRAATLRTALALWRGPALADLAYESFAASAAARLEDVRAAAQEDLVDAELALGHHADLVPQLEELVDAHPYDERARAQLMLALYRSGRQADALGAFQETRQRLADELGLDPSPALRELERAILLQEPSLVSPDGDAPATAERRKTVTVLSAALSPSEELDPEPQRAALVRGVAAARAAVEHHEGWVTARADEELMGVFGVPESHEDDALRAVRAATELRQAIAAEDELELRVGIDAGEALTGHGFVSGDVTRIAARLQRSAKPGEILLGRTALDLVGHAVEGRRSRVGFRLESVQIDAPAVAQQVEAPLVGRGPELDSLVEQFERARSERCCRLVLLVGEPGVGKSRLARELARRLEPDATVHVGRCVAYGEGAAYLPLRQVLASVDIDATLGNVEDGDVLGRRASALVGLEEGATSVDEGFWAVRRIFDELAGQRPLVIVLEDVHWAEAGLLELVDALVAGIREPLLLLCTGRELPATQPGWQENVLSLEPLSVEQTEALVQALNRGLAPAVQRRLVELAEGNPFYAEQLLAYVEELGSAALDSVPPSVESLLAARLDLLETEARSTAARAALIGREFSRAALSALSEASAPALSTHVLELVRRGYVRPAASAADEELYRFGHALLRDVAYASLPKVERAELHESYGDWLGATTDAPDEVVGFHLEQAHNYRTELGPADRRAKQLAADAGAHLGSAGMRAWRMNDIPATVNLLERASELLPPDDSWRRELLCELGVAERAGGRAERADSFLRRAGREAKEAKDVRVELRARLELGYFELLSEPEGAAQALLEIAQHAIPTFEAFEDDRALGRAWLMAGYVNGGIHGQHRAWEEAAERALEHYERAGSPASTCVHQLASALYFGPRPVPAAIGRCNELLEKANDLSSRASVLHLMGGLEAQLGDFERGRELVAVSQAIYEELGHVEAPMRVGMVSAHIELLADDYAGAERLLRRLCNFYESMGDRGHLAPRAAELAEAIYCQGRVDEAMDWALRSRDLSATDDAHAHLLWRPVLAKTLARSGQTAEAEALAREALRLAGATDWLNAQAKIRLDLSEILVHLGQAGEAGTLCEEAKRLFDLKGNVCGRNRALELLRANAHA